MATEDQLRERVEQLERRVGELTSQLDAVEAERDAARLEVSRLRGEHGPTVEVPFIAPLTTDTDVVTCGFCEGEGVYWVHDFEMQCKRCNGTGYGVRAEVNTSLDRH